MVFTGFDYSGMYEAGKWIWTGFPEKVWWEDSESPSVCHHLPASSRASWPRASATCWLWPWLKEWRGSLFLVERQPDCDFLWQGLNSAIEIFCFRNNSSPPSPHTQTNIYKHIQQTPPVTGRNTGLCRKLPRIRTGLMVLHLKHRTYRKKDMWEKFTVIMNL